ncbi:peptidoglycan editing factor PgeF [Sandaracinobacteroides hominis]|uniref:peptidoglycan editing factor PgeF n=1 Tax=Sandaracinobacteroides hominis TaxID=2780086 RepID=UPI0018F43EA7|nr:peptidoglycan editing factor PgeF [Sandaracinobacteroides hominis]
MITRLTARTLSSPHGFLGRTGGVSEGIFTSLNVGLGSCDRVEAVRENRRRAVEAVAPGARLVTLHQVHSALAVEAGDWPDDARPHADAVVTNRPGLALGILTADCGPLLFEDAEAGVIAAAHAGWKGAFTGVIGATVDLMEKLGARRDRIAAAVGPCIARRSYEVDVAFRTRFEDADAENALFFAEGRPGHAHFDLEAYCLHRLREAGVERAEALGADTKSDPGRFFSYRRTTLAGEPDYGRQISLIAL